VGLVVGVMIAGVFIKARGRQAFAGHVTRLAILATCGVLVGCGMILFAMRTEGRPTRPECAMSSRQ
jgi:hypothetical protein